jgi:spore coat protein CotH
MKKITILLFFILGLNYLSQAQSSFYNIDSIQKIEITINQPNWDYQMDTAVYGAGGYLLVTQVKVNGVIFDSVGLKFKGKSSFDSTRKKNPLHINLDMIHTNANYAGYSDIKLSNEYADPTWIREVLGYQILRNYMHAPQSNFAEVYINGAYYGIYTSDENLNKVFLNKHFYSTNGSYFKANPVNVISGHLPSLIYINTDSANYYDSYEMVSKKSWKDLIDLCDNINNNFSNIENVLDVDRAIWMLAFNNVTVNLDSYSGLFAQNYYLYRDENSRFNPIIWDLNMCFGGFVNTGLGSLTPATMRTMSPLLHSTNSARPLIKNLLADARFQKMYIAHMRTINNEFFVNHKFDSLAKKLQSIVDTSVQKETYGLYNYNQFQNSLTTNYANGSATVPGLDSLMMNRTLYLQTNTLFQNVPPTISNIIAPSTVALGGTVTIKCTVSNSTAVLLGYRNFIEKQFIKVPMVDDGNHNDGASGDGVFGASIIANASALQYYIYAENSTAAIFSPERAEYEFYNIAVTIPIAKKGDIVINEFLAKNSSYGVNELGSHEDWIELYNTTSTPLSLNGMYLTDDRVILNKYPFPSSTTINAHDVLIIFADNGVNSSTYLHCNFKLSGTSDFIMLSNGTTSFDSIAFANQSSDISLARCPDGTGSFKLGWPTFKKLNCANGMGEMLENNKLKVYPNPANQSLVISHQSLVNTIEIMDVLGRIVGSYSPLQRGLGGFEINVSELQNGIYFIKATDEKGNQYNSKFIKQ